MDKKKIFSLANNIITTILLLGIGILIGYIFGVRNAATSLGMIGLPAAQSGNLSAAEQADLDKLFSPFWQTWQKLHEDYLVQPLDDHKLLQGALRGMMDSLGDKHSSYMDPIQYNDMTALTSGDYEGIGVLVNTEGAYLTVSEIFKGSPAEKAGLEPGDQVLAVDGKDMTGVLPSLVRQKILGPKGTTVVLTIKRGEKEPFEISIQRATINVPSVEGELRSDGIAYIKLRTFGQKTNDELKAQLQEMLAKNPKGLIIDLRNNGGGLLTTAIAIGSQFLNDGTLVIEQYGDGKETIHKVIPGGIATEIPMVVLVNQFSASASELLAGALQDYGRATIVGTVTYGKGTVQEWLPLANQEGAVRITIAKWLTPKERNIHEVGIKPDVQIDLTEDDMKANRDPQLDKAVEILLKK